MGMSEIPPGWYQGDDGQSRYWNGSGWENSPQPLTQEGPQTPASATSRPSKRRKGLWIAASTLGVALLLAGGFFGASFISSITDNNTGEANPGVGVEASEPDPEDSAAEEAPTQASPIPPSARPTTQPPADTRTQAQIRDEGMEHDGFMVYQSGETYLRFLTDEESAQNPCGRYDCVDVIIMSVSGCQGGFYVRADILSNGTPVGWTNEMTASSQEREQILVRLEDYRDIGDEIRVTEINCHRY